MLGIQLMPGEDLWRNVREGKCFKLGGFSLSGHMGCEIQSFVGLTIGLWDLGEDWLKVMGRPRGGGNLVTRLPKGRKLKRVAPGKKRC